MQCSATRILTTHAGSLPRPPDLVEMLRARDRGQPYDAAALEARVPQAVAEVVRKQIETGLDVISDGEMGRRTPERPGSRPGAGAATVRRSPPSGP